MTQRIVIVGGGVMGVSIGLALARRGREVVLYEKRELAAGSSGRSGAILRCHYADREVVSMARDSLREYTTFEARTGRSIGFVRCGVLTLAGPRQSEWRQKIERNTRILQELGVDARLLGAREMQALVPGSDVGAGALGCWEPEGGFVDPRATVREFAGLARERGLSIELAAPALGLWIERGAVRGIESGQGRVEAGQVVVAAGPWTRALLAQSNIALPLRAVRPEQIFFGMPEPAVTLGAGSPALPHPVLIDLEHGYYTRCEPGLSRSRVSHIDYSHDREIEDPDRLDEEVGPVTRAWARAAVSARLPVYARQPEAGAEAAWYTLSPDAQPLLGPVPGVEGLYVASGFSGHGFKLAPSVGEGMAQLVCGEPVSAFDASFFAPERFARGAGASGGAFGL